MRNFIVCILFMLLYVHTLLCFTSILRVFNLQFHHEISHICLLSHQQNLHFHIHKIYRDENNKCKKRGMTITRTIKRAYRAYARGGLGACNPRKYLMKWTNFGAFRDILVDI